ncbi:MAG: c-type cytochrome [Anaerolineales bacterium]|nr:c-type cytochrome [Anaerolineales bacterium]
MKSASRSRFSLSARLVALLLPLTLGLLILATFLLQPQRQPAVAAAKGQLIAIEDIQQTDLEREAEAIVRQNDQVAPLLNGEASQFLAADRLAVSQLPAGMPDNCYLLACYHVTFYQLDRGETVEAIVDPETNSVISYWQNENSRPRATQHILPRAIAIASSDKEVVNLVGDPGSMSMMMVPMSTWLSDDACRDEWCVDLTFASPAGDGRIVHVTVNLEQGAVARIFYTRARPARQVNDANPPETENRYTDGCHEEFGWNVCWEMTAHDGLNFYDATFNDNLIFRSAKIAQVEVFYAAWPGGYRDEVGFNASVLAKFDTRITTLGDDSFEVRQMYTEEFNWPNCVCCYRYEQVMRFYADGRFDSRFISYGPGCDDLSSYRPFWRIDYALADDADNDVFIWSEESADWEEVATETDVALFGDRSPAGSRLATVSDELTYVWAPEPTDPLGLDEGRLFVIQQREGEGDGPVEAGPADTFIPPLQWLDNEPVSGANGVLWVIPFLKTKKAEPWFCMPDPEPDYSPCESILAAHPVDTLTQPEPTPTATASPPPTDTPEPGAEVTVAPAGTPTPILIVGTEPEEIIGNAGCGACHEIGPLGESGKVGPNLSNIGNTAADRVPGMSAEDYLRQSILEPNAHVVPDCPNNPCPSGAMPDYSTRLSAEQVDTLVDFLLSMTLSDEELAATAAVTPLAETAVAEDVAVDDSGGGASPALLIPVAFAVLVVAAVIGLLVWRRKVFKEDPNQ